MNWVIRTASRISMYAIFSILLAMFFTESVQAECSKPNAPDWCYQLRAEGDTAARLPSWVARGSVNGAQMRNRSAGEIPPLRGIPLPDTGGFQTMEVEAPTAMYSGGNDGPQSDEVSQGAASEDCKYQAMRNDSYSPGQTQYINDGDDGNIMVAYPADYAQIDAALTVQENRWSQAEFTQHFRSEGSPANTINCQAKANGPWAMVAVLVKSVQVRCDHGRIIALDLPSQVSSKTDGNICEWKQQGSTWVRDGAVIYASGE